jgi:hypothetical protein
MTTPLPSALGRRPPEVSPSALVGRMRTNTLTRSAATGGQASRRQAAVRAAAAPVRLPAQGSRSCYMPGCVQRHADSMEPLPQGLLSPPSGLSAEAGRRLEAAVSSVLSRRPSAAAAAAPVLVGDRLAVVPLSEKRDSLATDMAASGRLRGAMEQLRVAGAR